MFGLILAACTGGGGTPRGGPTEPSPPPAPLRIAVLADLPVSIARSPDLPAADGVELAVARRGSAEGASISSELVDLTDDPAIAAATTAELVADGAVVGVVFAPFADPPRQVVEMLSEAGMPAVVLTPDVVAPSGDPPWRRLAPPAAAQARTFTDRLRTIEGAGAGETCLVGPRGEGRLMPELAGPLRVDGRARIAAPPGIEPEDGEAPDPEAVASLVRSIDAAGCGTVVWTGAPVSGGALRSALRGEGVRRGSGQRFIVTDVARNASFVEAGPATDGAYGLCPCVDLSTSTSLDAQRFVNDFQFSAGAAPGPYAVEGFDAGTLLVDAIERAAASGRPADRSSVGENLRSLDSLEGLARRWEFAADAPTGAPLHIARVTGGRWHELPAD